MCVILQKYMLRSEVCSRDEPLLMVDALHITLRLCTYSVLSVKCSGVEHIEIKLLS